MFDGLSVEQLQILIEAIGRPGDSHVYTVEVDEKGQLDPNLETLVDMRLMVPCLNGSLSYRSFVVKDRVKEALAQQLNEREKRNAEFVALVARMTLPGEKDDQGTPFQASDEDNQLTLSNLIATARQIRQDNLF